MVQWPFRDFQDERRFREWERHDLEKNFPGEEKRDDFDDEDAAYERWRDEQDRKEEAGEEPHPDDVEDINHNRRKEK